MKKIIIMGAALVLCLSGCSSAVSQEEYESVVAEASSLSADLAMAESERDKFLDKYRDMNDEHKAYKESMEAYKESMAEYEGLAAAEAEARKIEAEKIAESEAAKRAAEESIAAAQKEAEEKAGFDTGITYDQLARTPDEYNGKKVKFTGKVLQVVESSSYTTQNGMRLAVNSNYDNIIYVNYESDLTASRILDNDIITIYGTARGIKKYTSTLGASISIPQVSAEKIDQ